MTSETEDRAAPGAPECALYDPASDLICTELVGHDGGLHDLDKLAFRESERLAFVARKHTGKKPYETKAKAKNIAARTSATFGGAPKQAYRCPECGWWHVGEAL